MGGRAGEAGAAGGGGGGGCLCARPQCPTPPPTPLARCRVSASTRACPQSCPGSGTSHRRLPAASPWLLRPACEPGALPSSCGGAHAGGGRHYSPQAGGRSLVGGLARLPSAALAPSSACWGGVGAGAIGGVACGGAQAPGRPAQVHGLRQRAKCRSRCPPRAPSPPPESSAGSGVSLIAGRPAWPRIGRAGEMTPLSSAREGASPPTREALDRRACSGGPRGAVNGHGRHGTRAPPLHPTPARSHAHPAPPPPPPPRFDTYQAYLDSFVTQQDLVYLGGWEEARRVVELGCVGGARARALACAHTPTPPPQQQKQRGGL